MSVAAAKRKIGILSGTFDPVHIGHITLALQAAETAGLDKVYLIPEASPRRKLGVTHLAHRLAMIKLATMPHPKLGVLDLPDKTFGVANTIPRLRQLFPDAQLYFVCGSDMIDIMPDWPLIERLFASMRLVVGIIRDDTSTTLDTKLQLLPGMPNPPIILQMQRGLISSTSIRRGFSEARQPEGVLGMTRGYIQRNWLYSVAS